MIRYSANLIERIDDRYLVTANGGILSTVNGGLRRLKPFRTHKGYLDCPIWGKHNPIHRAVLLAFHGARPAGMVAMHINADRADNRASNLRWGTPKENSRQMVLDGNARKPVKLTDAQVSEIVASTDRQVVIAERYGIHQSYVSHIKAGRKR